MTTVQELYAQYETEDQLQLLPEDDYELEVTSAKKKAVQKGIGIQAIYKVYSGPKAGARLMAGVFSLTPDSRGIFFQNMAGWGFDKSYFSRLPADVDQAFEQLAKDMVGRRGIVSIKHREHNGQTYNNIPIGRIKLTHAPATLSGMAAQAGATAQPPAAGAPLPVAGTPLPTQPQVAPVTVPPQALPDASTPPQPPAGLVAPAPLPVAPQVAQPVAAPAAPPAAPPPTPPAPPAAPAAPQPEPRAIQQVPQPVAAPEMVEATVAPAAAAYDGDSDPAF